MRTLSNNVTLTGDRVTFDHACLNGELVEATLNNRDWTITSTSPITVEPSVGCDRCGMHGWITGGVLFGTGVHPQLQAAADAERAAAEHT